VVVNSPSICVLENTTFSWEGREEEKEGGGKGAEKPLCKTPDIQ
jgi:hypothetical protein